MTWTRQTARRYDDWMLIIVGVLLLIGVVGAILQRLHDGPVVPKTTSDLRRTAQLSQCVVPAHRVSMLGIDVPEGLRRRYEAF